MGSRSPGGPRPEIAYLEAQVASAEYQRNVKYLQERERRPSPGARPSNLLDLEGHLEQTPIVKGFPTRIPRNNLE